MVDNIQASNNSTQYQITQYKTTYSRDVRGCPNVAIQQLMIFYLGKTVWVCKKCSHELKEDGLVESVIDELVKAKK